MALKIKWNDDRVQGTATALLLIARDRLSRGDTTDLIRASLADYRRDPADYKLRKAGWPDVREIQPLTNAGHIAYYQKLLSAVDGVLKKFVEGKRQFNSLIELDNFLVFTLDAIPVA